VSRQQRLTLVATILGSTVVFLDSTVVNVALPAIGRALHADLADLQWTVDAYLLTLTAFLLPGGALGDRLGRRRVFSVGLAAFGATSILCGLAPDPRWLAAARLVQGVAGALLVPGSLSVLRASFRPEDEPAAVGTWAALASVSTAFGPLAGGWLAEAVSWRAIFFVNAPLVAAALWAARFVPESRDPAKGRPDLLGAALAALGLGGVVLALVEGAERGLDGRTVAAGATGIAGLTAFLAVEALRRDPMLPLGLFRVRAFTGVNATTLAVYFGLGGAMFLLVLQLQAGLGWTPLASGAALLPVTALLTALSPLAGRAAGALGPRPFLATGPLAIAAGLFLLGRIGPGARYAADVLPGILLLGIGLGATVAPLTSVAMGCVEPERAGVASGVNNAVARLAGLLAVAVLPLAGGMTTASLAHGAMTAGYGRAMTVAAAVTAAGAVVALLTLGPAPARGAAAPRGARGGARAAPARAPARRTPPAPPAPAGPRGPRPPG